MTEQEAEAWAARLERVWVSTEWHDVNTNFQSGRYGFEFVLNFHGGHLAFWEDDTNIWFQIGSGVLEFDEGRIIEGETQLEQSRFAAEWLFFFRRGCWLSGADIEATAHEKAEWMQGFSREELETWNLKM